MSKTSRRPFINTRSRSRFSLPPRTAPRMHSGTHGIICGGGCTCCRRFVGGSCRRRSNSITRSGSRTRVSISTSTYAALRCPRPAVPGSCASSSPTLSRPLDRAKPLWELYLVEGLENDRVAAVAKVHHALADGVASAELLDLFFDTAADARHRPDPTRGHRSRCRRKPVSHSTASANALGTLRHQTPANRPHDARPR